MNIKNGCELRNWPKKEYSDKQEDFKKIKKALKNKLNDEQAYKDISEELKDLNKIGVSDIFSGLSKGKCYGSGYHENEYWELDSNLILKEAFAEMFTVHFSPNQYKEMEKYFPKAFEIFNTELRRLLK